MSEANFRKGNGMRKVKRWERAEDFHENSKGLATVFDIIEYMKLKYSKAALLISA